MHWEFRARRVTTRKAARRRDTPLTIDPRLLLLDADRSLLIGRPEMAAGALTKPIAPHGETVGYLGYVPRPELIASIERVYLRRQHLAFTAIAAGMLATALLLGAGLALWLTRRVRVPAAAARALTAGDYGVRLNVRGDDELAQLARDFNALASTLAAVRQARRQWIADIAHELRTPLAVLRAEIESLEDGVRPLDQSALASLGGETSRLARLVEDLHTLSLSDLGALSYYKEPLMLAEVVEDVLAPQRRTLSEQGFEVRMELDRAARVLGDETRLAQVFANLLQNSVRYTDAPGTIAVELRRDGERVDRDLGGQRPRRSAGDVGASHGSPLSAGRFAQSGKRRFGARSGHREGAGARSWRHARCTRESSRRCGNRYHAARVQWSRRT